MPHCTIKSIAFWRISTLSGSYDAPSVHIPPDRSTVASCIHRRVLRGLGHGLRSFTAAVGWWGTPNATEQAGVNRWTDNIWCTQSYCKKNFSITGKDFWQNLDGVNDEIDNVA